MSVNIKKHLSLLGKKVKDKVTGLCGVVTSVGFDLYGCIQVIIHPGVDTSGKLHEQHWFDVARLEVIHDGAVMTPPNFIYGEIAEGKKGPAEKPKFHKN